MTLSDIAIRRPVLTSVSILIIIVLGIASFRGIGIDLFPRVEFPMVTVTTVLPGADPETIETTVTDPIEEAVSNISSIKNLRSTSAEGVSMVTIEFNLEKNNNIAYQEVQSKLAEARGELPEDVEEPVIGKVDVDGAPIMAIVVSADKSIRDITHIADRVVKDRIQRLDNVGQVKLVGGRDRQIWIWIDPGKLVGHGLAVQDVVDALRREHIEMPGGRVETGPGEYIVRTKAEFASAEEMNGLVVAYRGGAPIRVSDIGHVEDGLQEERSMARLNGTRAVSLLVRRQSGTNTVEVARAIKSEVAKIQEEVKSQGITLTIAQDSSLFIQHSVREVQFHLLFGTVLAIFIVFVFLRNIRSTFISAMVIPTSVIGTFVLMYALGFTQNSMTLTALSLAIGLLIDDSIVVQENIMRHIEHGRTRKEAAKFATSEIALAVFSTTLAVLAVFVPVAFMKGQMGRFFYQFGLTVAFAVTISLYVAFTLDPMLSSRILNKPRQTWLYRTSEAMLSSIDRAYGGFLRRALRMRWLVVLGGLALFAGTLFTASKYLRFEFMPQEDQAEFNVSVRAPLGSSIYTTDMVLENIRARIQNQPWVEYCFTTIGSDSFQRVNEGSVYVKMTGKRTRKISQLEAMTWTREHLADITDAKTGVEIVPKFGGSGGNMWADVQLEFRGPDLNVLDQVSSAVVAKMRSTPGYVDVDTSYEKNKPEANFYINRGAAADLGVSSIQLASTIRAMVGGIDVAKFRADGDRYDVSVRLDQSYRDAPEKLPYLTIRTASGQLVRVQSVATMKEESGPVQITRYSRTREIMIKCNLDRRYRVQGEAVAEITKMIDDMKLPPGYTYAFIGMADSMKEGFANLFLALMLSIVFIYLVLAAQFESFVHPFTIMLAIPFSVTGAVAALLITGMTVTIYTMIGVIMLFGLVTKNGILLIDYTNTLRRRDGMERNEAVIQAGPVRLRPIVMTTMAIVFGMLPMAFALGEGAESRKPMAVAVIGGLLTSTLLTLIVVPIVYTLLDDLIIIVRRIFLRIVSVFHRPIEPEVHVK